MENTLIQEIKNTGLSEEQVLKTLAVVSNYAKEKFDVGLMNAFDFNQSQTVYVTAQSDLIRAKYDYIFKSKVVELYFGIPIIQKQ